MAINRTQPRPTISAPRGRGIDSAEAPEPVASGSEELAIDAATGRASTFEEFRTPLVNLDRSNELLASEGRKPAPGTADESIGGDMLQLLHRIARDFGLVDEMIPPEPPTAREGLSEETTAKMDALLRQPYRGDSLSAKAVFSNPGFSAMSVEDREKVVDVMAAAGDQGAAAMHEIFRSSNGDLLNRTAKDGTRLIDSLDLMGTSNEGRLALRDLLKDVANPGRIKQGQAPTCTVTSMQYELASEQPAEYARLVSQLTVNGQATTRGGGVLEVNAQAAIDASVKNKDHRSTTEAIFQTAAMEFANGADSFNLDAQNSTSDAGKVYRGLFPDQIRNMIGELFGVKYKTLDIGSDEEATQELNEIVAREQPNRPVLFDIDMGKFNHCVSLDKIEGNRVYFRDPTNGKKTSMSKDEFRQRLVAVHYAPSKEIDEEFVRGKYGGKAVKSMLF